MMVRVNANTFLAGQGDTLAKRRQLAEYPIMAASA